MSYLDALTGLSGLDVVLPMNDAAGTTIEDASGNNRDGSMSGDGYAHGFTGPLGANSRALHFEESATPTVIDVTGYAPYARNSSRTFFGLVYVDRNSSDVDVLIGGTQAGDGEPVLELLAPPNTPGGYTFMRWYADVGAAGANFWEYVEWAAETDHFEMAGWHWWALTVVDTNGTSQVCHLWLDGVDLGVGTVVGGGSGSPSPQGYYSSSGDFRINSRGTRPTEHSLNGRAAYVGVYGRKLSDGELTGLYDAYVAERDAAPRGGMIWELCDLDQAVLATLDDRADGANVAIGRHAARSAEVQLDLEDDAAPLVEVGSTMLRCRMEGWDEPLFCGRVTGQAIGYDDGDAGMTVTATDPLAQLEKAIVLVNKAAEFEPDVWGFADFGSGNDASAVMWFMLAYFSANGYGIDEGLLAPSTPNPGVLLDDGAFGGAPGSAVWSNPDRAASSNDLYAVANIQPTNTVPSGKSHYLRVEDLRLTIPDGATIDGVEVEVERHGSLHGGGGGYGDAAWVHDDTVKLIKGGSISGTNKATTTKWPGADAVASYGGDGDKWGLTLSRADVVASNFGVAIAVTGETTGLGYDLDAAIDRVHVNVHYTYDGHAYATDHIVPVSLPAGTRLADALRSIVGLDGMPEFELSPVERTGSMVEFNTYHPKQGEDKSASLILRLAVVGEEDTILEFGYEPTMGEIVNRYTVVGEAGDNVAVKDGLNFPAHPAYQASHAASIAEYGVWEALDAAGSTSDATLLRHSAIARVAACAYPVAAFSASLDPDTAPEFAPDGDFWIGDTIGLEAALPDGTMNLTGRIASANFTEAENGDVYIDLGCEPDEATGVSVSSLTVVMDAQEGTVPPQAEAEEAPVGDQSNCAAPGPNCAKKKNRKLPECKDPCAKKKKGKKK